MGLNITKGNETLDIKTIVLLIWGPPGQGKSSTGFTASKTICLDFDHGAHRSQFRGDTVRIESFQEVENPKAGDYDGYETIMVDTGGRCLDRFADLLMERNGKLRTASGGLTLAGFGALKAGFTGWVKRVCGFGKDIVFVCHEKEDRRGGDEVYLKPDIQGGSYGEVFKISDGIGYLNDAGAGRYLDFSPREFIIGKNPSQLPVLRVPNFNDDPHWLAGVISRCKEGMGQVAQIHAKARDAVGNFREELEYVKTATDANAILVDIKRKPEGVQVQCKHLLNDHIATIGVEWNGKKFAKVKK